MSMVAYYARMSSTDLVLLRADVDGFWKLPEMPWDLSDRIGPDGAETLYIDKDWKVLSWLCSETGRAEQRNETAHFSALRSRDGGDSEELAVSLARAAEKLGFSYVNPRDLPDDPLLAAIQGHRTGDEKATIAGLGLAAVVFDPTEVNSLSSALNRVNEAALREHFEVDEMMLHDLPIEEPTDFEEFCLPAFERLKTLYARASNAGQHVVVVIS